MNHVNQNIVDAEVLEEDCVSECTLEITSADIIGDISLSFNSMTHEIFKRLELEGETRKFNSKLMHSVELKEVSDTIINGMAAVISAKAGLLYGGKAEKMQLLSHFGVDKTDGITSIFVDQFGPIEKALESEDILSYSQLDGWEWFSQSTPLGNFRPGSILLIPLMAKQQSVGLVVLACGIQTLSPQQQKALETLRSFAAPYLDNSILHKRITELAAIDDLTNILNRRFGMRRLKEEYSRSTRHGVPISAVMIDIDHFKNFNDTFGHNAGDAVLKMVASTIQNNLRAEDMVCRYGGEEFLMGLAGAGMNDSALVTERIRRAIETNHISWGNKHLSVTISSGIATYPVVRASVCEELITAADKALYAAKEFGRNQVTVNDGVQILRFADLKIGDLSKKE
jgi:diguanylate cyclase (GGDEF)-like protein